MRYPAFFLNTNDQTIKFKRPGRVNVSIKRDAFKIEMFTKIPLDKIGEMTVQHDVSDKELSAGKAVAGAVLAGGIGAVAGAAMGGKKVTSTLTVNYTNANGESCNAILEAKLAHQIKDKFDKYRQTQQQIIQTAQSQIKPRSSSIKRGLFIYYTWPYQVFKKLKKGQNDHASKEI